jgi:hypothetical protein
MEQDAPGVVCAQTDTVPLPPKLDRLLQEIRLRIGGTRPQGTDTGIRDPSAPAPTVGRSLVADAKLAIAAGDRLAALALLDGLRGATTDKGRLLAPALAEALVATARGETQDESDRQALAAVELTRSALRQILDWLGSLPFDAEDLADMDVAIAARRRNQEQSMRDDELRLTSGGTLGRALGTGWLEWRWVSKAVRSQIRTVRVLPLARGRPEAHQVCR